MMRMREQFTLKEQFQLWFNTLFYNSCTSWSYAMDTCMEPLFYVIDHTTVYIGRMFVVSVVVMIGSVVVIVQLIGIPIYWEYSPALTMGLLVFGYWLLINITFNFVQGVRVSPGLPSNPKLLSSVTICKKCISPKPPRTHHCSICNRCYLKMDHHCPWMNNCIGHFNHRYFYLTMVYIVAGCIFLIIWGASIAYQQLILDEDVIGFIYDPSDLDSNNEILLPKLQESPDGFKIMAAMYSIKSLFSYFTNNSTPSLTIEPKGNGQGQLLFGIPASKTLVVTMIYFVALLVIGAGLALGGLSYWHGKLIANGETSIEYHLNRALRKTQGEKFNNAYNRGTRENWIIFFGLDQEGKTFWRHVLFPSTHPPTGNGYDWSHLAMTTSNLTQFRSL